MPPTIKVDQPNPALEIEKSPFYLSTQAKPWIADSGVPRRASVSSFGFGGTNFHVTVEEYTGSRQARVAIPVLGFRAGRAWRVVGFAALSDQAARLSASLVDSPDMLSYIARSTQSAYDAAQPHRLAIVADSVSNLRAMLDEARGATRTHPASRRQSARPRAITTRRNKPGRSHCCFPVRAASTSAWAADIPQLYEPALSPWETARAEHLNADRDLHQVVWPKTAFTDDERAQQTAELTKTEWAQPGIGAHSLSLLSVIRALGIAPVAVGGHSFGEVSALCAAGVFSDEAALLIARARGALMAQAATSSDGAMCAVTAPVDWVRKLIAEWGLSVVIANHNAPDQFVLSGESAAIEDAATTIQRGGHECAPP